MNAMWEIGVPSPKLTGLFACGLALMGALASNADGGEWPSYGADNAGSKYSALKQINADNFDELSVARMWTSPDALLMDAKPDDRMRRRAKFKATPLMIDMPNVSP